MTSLPSCGLALVLALLLGGSPAVSAHAARAEERLPVVGPAPQFTLTAATGERVALTDLRGKVLAVTFLYASCADTCPLLTAQMVAIQRRLGADFGPRIGFVSITVDPEVDTPEVLRGYAKAHGADHEGWSFLTGTPAEIKDVLRRYGVYARKSSRGDVDHLFLTSLIDGEGMLRVQYLGVRFDPAEMQADLQKLLRE
ncbi:MAG: SCO family protein [Burkholderiales bacterium]|nr:MAG: SCO family protein [Burkholderiales bacterium]